jgi:FAD/FMN-containing dehydrogenase
MTLCPGNQEELAALLRGANNQRKKVEGVDLTRLNRLLQHTPEDLTVTVEAGMTLAALQSALAHNGQWLPSDPPNPEGLSIARLLATNASGPRRFGFGTVRDHLIGLQVALADGRLVRSGGKVVKNVAGYDLLKLFVGAHDSLGIIVEATFKLLPLPEAERFVQARCESLEEAGRLIESVLESPLTPVVLDLHHGVTRPVAGYHVVLALAGTREEVAWQRTEAELLGIGEETTLDYEQEFRALDPSPARPHSVLPSRLIETLRGVGDVPFVARAGNGVIYHRGGPALRQTVLPLGLMRQVKEAFDPNQILPVMSC